MEIESYTSVEAVAGEWDDLAARVGATPFLRPGWIEAWLAAFGAGVPEVLAVRREGRLAGVLPVLHRARGIHAPANWHTPEWGPVAEDGAAASALFARLFARRPVYALLRFLGPFAAEAQAAAEAAGYAAQLRPLQESPYISLVDGWEALPQPRAKNVAKARQKLGGVTLELLDRVDGTLDELLALEGSGWKHENGTAIASRADTRRFYEDVLAWGERVGILRIAFLRAAGRRIAVEFGFEDGRRFYNVKGGYDPTLAKHSPGLMIAHELIRNCADRGLESFEYLGAAEPMKLEWTDRTRPVVALEAFSPRLAGIAARVAYTRGRPLARRVLRR